MPMVDPPYALWSIWRDLSLLERLYCLILSGVSVYCLCLAFLAALRNGTSPRKADEALRISSGSLRARCLNLERILGGMFYLFGIVLFIGLENVGKTLDGGPVSWGMQVLGNFILQCAFAANIFVVFLILHCVQWCTFKRLDAS